MEPTQEVVSQVTQDAMQSWSDERRRDFVKLYRDRANRSIGISSRTVDRLIERGQRSGILGHLSREQQAKVRFRSSWNPSSDDYQIAEERAETIFNELPPMRKAVEVISAETAQWMDERDKIVAQCKKLMADFNAKSQPVVLSQVNQKMTVGELRSMVEGVEKERRKVIAKLNELGAEGAALESKIQKSLFRGVPGLREALLAACTAEKERADALAKLVIKIEEKVMFGDSDAAMALLQSFEKDESKLQDNVKARMREAMEKILGEKTNQLTVRRRKKS